MSWMGLKPESHLFVFFCLNVIYAMKTDFECDGKRFRYKFDRIFSLDVLLNNRSIAHLFKDGAPEVYPTADGGQLSNVSGLLTDTFTYLRGTIDLECDNSNIVCELYGYGSGDNYIKRSFQPVLEYQVGISETSISKFQEQSSGDILIFCSAIVGSNKTSLSWQSRSSLTEDYILEQETYSHNLPVSNCRFKVTSYLLHRAKDTKMYFRCLYGNTEVAFTSVETTYKDALAYHVFLSSILVYLHFVIMPVVCSCLERRDVIKKFRDPSNDRMRILRGSISLIVAFIFAVWWLSVIFLHKCSFDCFVSFFVIETIFLLGYGIVRLLSYKFEKEGDRHLYNSRVALSFGAVLTPLICWLMIKVQQNTELSPLEGVWWFFTVASLLAFISVSHDRELKAWEKMK